ncbi:MAG: hypothetical protein QOF18_2978, partial [Frankiaceae bacterium]|nr:hypothetical protein [Frankiaceae bacterium]
NLRVTDGRIAGSIGVVMDVTDRREAEAQRAALARRLSLQARAVELVTELDVESRLDALAALIVPALAECCAIHLVEPEGIRLAGVRHADPSLQPYIRELIESFPVGVDQPYGAGAVIASGQPQLLPEVPDAVLVATTKDRPESLAGFRALQLRSGFSVPLISRGRALGALSLGRTSDSAWTEDDRALVEQIASTAALALDNAQIYGDEHVARAASERNLRRLGLLAEVTTALVRSLDLDHVLDALAGLLVPRLAEMCTIDVVDEGRTRLVAVRAIDDAAIASLREAEVRRPRRLNEAGAVAQVIRSGVPLLIADVDNDFLRERAVDDEQLKQLLALDIHSSAIAPITARGHVLGAISLLGLGPDGRRFADEDVDLLVEIGKRAGLAIDNAQLYGREHSLAEALQRSLLPELMPLPGLDVAARYLPSSDHAQVGGDWFDAFPLADGAVGIAVGDAMGHDPRASGAMGQLRSVLRSYAFEGALPGVVLEKLDRLVQGFAMAQLATVFYGRLEPAGSDGSRLFRYSSAGHPPPLLCSPGGDSKLLDDGQSIVIGVPLDDTDRPEAVVTLSPGSLLICYTDGLVEGRHRPIDRGTAILRDAVQSLGPGASANEVCDHVITVMVGEDRDDDIAVLVVGLREDSR